MNFVPVDNVKSMSVIRVGALFRHLVVGCMTKFRGSSQEFTRVQLRLSFLESQYGLYVQRVWFVEFRLVQNRKFLLRRLI
jgi:hypothetical protein